MLLLQRFIVEHKNYCSRKFTFIQKSALIKADHFIKLENEKNRLAITVMMNFFLKKSCYQQKKPLHF